MKQRNSYNQKWNLISASLLILFFFLPMLSMAEEVNVSVKAILPDNQITKDAGYYDLKVTPGEEQVLNFQLFNNGEEDATVNLEINPAYTGDSGAFDYTRGPADRDESMAYDLSSIASVDKVVSIPKKGDAQAKISLKIPKEGFDGMILGAVRVTAAEKDEKAAEDDKDGVSIKNKFAYVVAIRLRVKEEAPKGELKLKTVFASQVAGRNTVKVNLQNPIPVILDKMSYEAQIYKKGANDVLHSAKYENYRVAPNSNYNVPISWENQAFQAGTYQLKLLAKSAETDQEWKFDQEFVITADEAKKLNDEAAELETDYSQYIIYGAIALGAVILLLIILMVLSRRKKKRKKLERRQQKSRKNSSSKSKKSSNSTKKRSNR